MTPMQLRPDRFALDRERLRQMLDERATAYGKTQESLCLLDFSMLDPGRALWWLVHHARCWQSLREPAARRLIVYPLSGFAEVAIATSAPELDPGIVLASPPVAVGELVGDRGLSRMGFDALAAALDAACREGNRLVAASESRASERAA